MMPKLQQGLRGLGRRVTVQQIKQKVVDREAVNDPIDILRTTMVLTPMPARKIAIKPEGQRTWKWWEGASAAKLQLGWFVRPDGDKKKLYEVMEDSDWSQAGIYTYQLAEAPR